MNTSFCESETSTQFSEINSSFSNNNSNNFKSKTLPCAQEFYRSLVKLQPIPKSYAFSDLNQYKKIMKDLLKENYFIPIRDSIKKLAFQANNQSLEIQKPLNDKCIEVFENYSILKIKLNQFKGLQIDLNVKRYVLADKSNQIKPNQLLVFFDKQSNKMFLGKAYQFFQKDQNELKKQKQFYDQEENNEEDNDSEEVGLNSQTHLQEEKISFVMDLNQNLLEFLQNLNQIENKYLLFQPNQYWYSTEIALKSIEFFQMQFDSIAFPSQTLKNQIQQDSCLFPEYDFLKDTNRTEYINLVQQVIASKKSVLDQSQHETLKYALQNSSTIIQGPPGTGKTYLGCQIIDALLKTYQSKSNRPILVISKKNKSLDSMLLKIEKFTKSILRIGKRFSLVEIEKYSVTEQSGPFKQISKSKEPWYKIENLLKKLKKMQQNDNAQNQHLCQLTNQIKQQLQNFQKDIDKRVNQSESSFAFKMCNFMSQFQIIGMTVSGYQIHYQAIEQLQPEIVIVEEASEILEPDFITILSPWVKHLIQIGDHQQLRPVVKCHKIQEEYNLRLSYFERLIQGQHVVCKLQNQRRMRTQFANFTRLFYSENYIDDMSVKKYAQINYINNKTSMQMIQHQFPEQSGGSQSKVNYFEALYAIEVVKYILKKKMFQQEDIVILCMYKAQQQLIYRLINSDIMFCKVQVFTVDQYQGEENEIVILSCVRSNSQNEIGFLEFENRINVAFSRARQGFICLGNFLMYEKKSEMWKKINKLAKEQNSFYDQTKFDFNQFQVLFKILSEKYSEIGNIKCQNCERNFHLGIC
ncbi:hypothetical protein ABPG74_013590 [Tetrahymena malaccensis]